MSMKIEINLADYYRRDIIVILSKVSMFFSNQKTFKSMTREDILAFLDSFRKIESVDPMHKWIGTYNTYRIHLMRFFKWLYFPDIEQDNRPKPSIIENIPQLKRKEKSIYKPTDLWTPEDDSLFLKYCHNVRDRCYHAMSRDSAARPHELLKLRIKDVVFKLTNEKKQYAEILVNGKTGSRHIPLIDSVPHVKDWIAQHPQSGNPNSILLCGFGKSLGRIINVVSLRLIYQNYKDKFFPKLLDNPNVLPADKHKIKELLKKPWNPYIRRHSALTEKSGILKEHYLRQYAGWSPSSQMHLKYLHYYGNESNNSLLEAYGVVTKDKKLSDVLKPKQCPNCNEPNKPDSRFCATCRMVLTYDAYNETLENQKEKESEVQRLQEKYQQDMKSMREEIKGEMKNQIAQLLATLKPEIVKEGLS
ncbi:MAG: site-specific integrase [Thermoproteota archaeon]|nr:site-specific integrase [Thermoproteota archaeon]